MPDISSLSTDRKRLLIISPDPIKKKMAGPGIRYWELAKTLSQHIEVTLAVHSETNLTSNTISIERYDPDNEETIYRLEKYVDMILGTTDFLQRFPALESCNKPLIIDLYAPFLLEDLERNRADTLVDQFKIFDIDADVIRKLLTHGDFFLCASERQRDLWLGALIAYNRINPLTYQYDESLYQLIDLVPFGTSSQIPQATRPVMKSIYSGIANDDKIILWGGGIWNWLDPLTPIRAMPQVIKVEPKARLFFFSGRHPNPNVPEMQMAVRARELADELGLLGQYVFFHDEWVEYEDRVNYLLEADIAVSAHFAHLETRFSYRTRLLDCIWTSLPMVATDGDTLADLIQTHNLGCVVPPNDVDQMAKALMQLLTSPNGKLDFKKNFDCIRPQFTWEHAAQPLIKFCLDPNLAKDHPTIKEKVLKSQKTTLFQMPGKALKILVEQGPLAVIAEILRYLLWKVGG